MSRQIAKLTTAKAQDSENLIISRLKVTPDIIADFCKRWDIIEFALFGSVLRDDFSDDSDIDVMLEFDPGRVLGLDFIDMADELEDLFGRSVDVACRSSVESSSNYIRRESVLGSARVIYERKQRLPA
ncbi:MAG: nucleotidyltransferase domain-containing protein [Betaproteobacteria bacterium]|nr:nucleotidyltransferase domain-containing protein [Betaproteobacteria bacterium]